MKSFKRTSHHVIPSISDLQTLTLGAFGASHRNRQRPRQQVVCQKMPNWACGGESCVWMQQETWRDREVSESGQQQKKPPAVCQGTLTWWHPILVQVLDVTAGYYVIMDVKTNQQKSYSTQLLVCEWNVSTTCSLIETRQDIIQQCDNDLKALLSLPYRTRTTICCVEQLKVQSTIRHVQYLIISTETRATAAVKRRQRIQVCHRQIALHASHFTHTLGWGGCCAGSHPRRGWDRIQ